MIGEKRTSRVPCAEQVDNAWVEAGFAGAKNYAQPGKLLIRVDEAHGDGDAAPEQRNGRDVYPGSDGADKNRRRRLEDDVGDEED